MDDRMSDFRRKIPSQNKGQPMFPSGGGTIRKCEASVRALVNRGRLKRPDEILNRLLEAHGKTERELLLEFAAVAFEMIQSVPFGDSGIDRVRSRPQERSVEPSYRALFAHLWKVDIKVEKDDEG